jgi:hypothetical protein
MRAGSRLTAQLTGGIYLYFQKAYLQIISYPNLWEDRVDYNQSIPLRKNGKKKENTETENGWKTIIISQNIFHWGGMRGDIDVTFEVENEILD